MAFMQPDSPLKVVMIVVSLRLLLTGWISNPNLCPCFHAQEAWNSLLQSLQRITAPSGSLHRQHLVVHRCRGTVFRPSTRRRREASVKVISGVNTEHNIWAQPCPSVGLQARKNVSDGGQGFLVLSSRPARGHSRQSGLTDDSKLSSFSHSSQTQDSTLAGSTIAPQQPACTRS